MKDDSHDFAQSEFSDTVHPLMVAKNSPPLLLATLNYSRIREQRQDLARSTASVTRRILRNYAEHIGTERPVGHITTRQTISWWDAQTCGRSTARNRLSVVRTFLDWCVASGYLRANPTKGIKPPKEPRRVPKVLRPDAVGVLLSEAPDERTRAVIALMVQCGLRCVEVVRLEMGDIDDRNRSILVTGKGSHERVLPVPDQAWSALQRYFDAHPPSQTGPVFRSYLDPNKGVTAHTISTYVSRYMADAGIKRRALDGVSAHALRRTCATDMLDGGAHIRQVQAALGHSHLQTTEVYLRRLEVDDLRKAMGGRHYSWSVLLLGKLSVLPLLGVAHTSAPVTPAASASCSDDASWVATCVNQVINTGVTMATMVLRVCASLLTLTSLS